jgi:pSer/pThr/pTyr-binding forkhead associated (FHA) protein
MDTCPACGANVTEGAETCPSCGAAVREVTASFPPVDDGVESSAAVAEAADGPLLVVRKGPEVGERFYLDRPRLVVGRDPASDIFLNDITVSREHAVLDVHPAEVHVSDAGSLNGTYVNGVSVDRAVLRNGDQLQIGRFQMVFLSGEGQ